MFADASLNVVVYAPSSQVEKWIEHELDRDGAMVQIARSMNGLVKAMLEDPSPRPHLLIVDIDAIAPAELMQLHTIRHQGWFGSIIGLGRVPAALRMSLCIDQTLVPPFVKDQLRDAVSTLREPQPTVRIPVLAEVG